MPRKSATELRLSRPPRGPAFEYNPADDPAPDCYTVEWKGRKVLVRHYRDRNAEKEHCKVRGGITDADRAKVSDVITPEIACLARLRMPCGVDK